MPRNCEGGNLIERKSAAGTQKGINKNNNNFVHVSSLYLCDLQIIPKCRAVFLTITVMEEKYK